MDDRRVVLYHPRYVAAFRNLLAEAKNDLHAVHERHVAEHERYVAELADLHREVVELREIMQLIVGTLRTQAESDVATLRRQLETALARIERDQQKPLH
jgi:hypothetical protein